MDTFLTTRQVQELLKVDRITVYRMLQDGRLEGVKIGQQWRFSRQAVEQLLAGGALITPAVSQGGQGIPVHCVQIIQNIFADLGEVAALVVDGQAEPLTALSNGCTFCRLMLDSPSGRQACRRSWQEAISLNAGASQTHLCHAGLNYLAAAVGDGKAPAAYLLAGQFYLEKPDAQEEAARVEYLAVRHGIEAARLGQAAAQITVIDPAQRARIISWPARVALALTSILQERSALVNRLQQIAEISSL